MLGLRGAGAEVVEYITDDHPEALNGSHEQTSYGASHPMWLQWDALKAEIEGFSPHLIVCNAGGLSFTPEVSAMLRERCSLLGIALSDPDVLPTTRQIAPYFDLFLTNAPNCLPDYRQSGARAYTLPWGTNESYFAPAPVRPEYDCQVLVFGSAYPDRIETVQELCRRFQTHVYGEGWEPYGVQSRGLILDRRALSILRSARMTVVFCKTSGNHTIVKPYLFNYLAAGALVVTNQIPEVEEYFDFGKELIGFQSTEDLAEKIGYYLEHPTEAIRIQLAGRDRVLRQYTWRKRWPEILSLLRQDPEISQ